MVMWHSDPDFLRNIAEERWEREREAAARRRLVRGDTPSGALVSALRRAQRFIEQMYYQFSPGRFSSASDGDDVPPMSDAEMARLLALLAPGAGTLEVERVSRRPEPDEEPCLPGPCRERAS
jgi:hypothetical protein